jgi:L-asparaginase
VTTAGRLVLFTLGGTIAAPVDATGSNARMRLSADDLVRDLLGDEWGSRVEARTFRTVPSAALTFADLRELAIEVDAAVAAGAQGAVITVGTDSLEEVAYALDLQYGGDAPVVVTGAMRNAGLPGSDGEANLRAALAVASSADARGLGVVVVLADRIHAARHVRKLHTSSLDAFGSVDAGPIGSVVEGRPTIALRPARRIEPLRPARDFPAVRLIRVSLDEAPALVEEALVAGSAGLVVEVFGAGHVSPEWVEPLRRAAASVPVVYVSRTGAGGLYRSTASYPGSERDLLDAGLIPADAFDGLKARVLLRMLLASGAGRDEIAARFAAG